MSENKKLTLVHTFVHPSASPLSSQCGKYVRFQILKQNIGWFKMQSNLILINLKVIISDKFRDHSG